MTKKPRLAPHALPNEETLMRSIPPTTLLILTACAMMAGCTDADPSLLLSSPILGTFENSGGQQDNGEPPACEELVCVAEDSGTESPRPALAGFIDLSELEATGQFPYYQPGSFFVTVSLTNRLADNSEGNRGLRINTNDIVIQGVRVTWTDPEGNEIYSPGSVGSDGFRALSALVRTGGQGSATIIDVPLISGTSTQIQDDVAAPEPEFLRAVLRSEFGESSVGIPRLLYVNLQAFGESLDGEDVESNIVRYPIDICDGCTATNPAFLQPLPCTPSGQVSPTSLRGATPMCAAAQ